MKFSHIVIGTIIIAIVSIILASAWNELIWLVIRTYTPTIGNEVLYTFIYVSILTAIVVFVAAIFIPKIDEQYRSKDDEKYPDQKFPHGIPRGLQDSFPEIII